MVDNVMFDNDMVDNVMYNGVKLPNILLKILRCEHRKIFKVCLAILQHCA